MRERVLRNIALGVVVAGMLPVVLGCPKKTPPPQESVKPQVTTRTQPSPGEAGTSATVPSVAPPSATRPGDAIIETALKGDDIPLAETPSKNFVDPNPQERKILRTIYFDYDKSDIREEYRSILEGIAQWGKSNPGRLLLIEGHCDERGTNEYNLALGERRALAVRRYLIGLGITSDRLHTISYGEEKPAMQGHDESAWSKNRRVEFKVSAPE
jgi:peptidoglycan-associated lipoprotein